MRFVSVDNLKAGMIAGKPLFGDSGHILIQAGTTITEGFINKLKAMMYNGLYIDDAFSEGIEIESVVSHETRKRTAVLMHHLRGSAMKGNSNFFQSNMREITNVLNQMIDEIVKSSNSLVNIIDMKDFDSYTYQHSVNVCVLSCVIGLEYDMPRTRLNNLAIAAILHDIGKIFIDIDIINKPGKLTEEEMDIMKTHSSIGIEKLSLNKFLQYSVTSAILQHHERYDGSGYPFGKKGEEIPTEAQIIAMADVYDAITSKRAYALPIAPPKAYEYITGNSGIAFNPELIEIFARKIAPFPLGIQVRLSNGLTGIVCRNYEDNLLRPLIKLMPARENEEPRFLDMKNDTDSYNIIIENIVM